MSCARPLSNRTFSVAPVADTKKNQLLPSELEDLVLDYIADENFDSINYSSTTLGGTLFEKRLPVYALLLHAVRGEYVKVDAMLAKNPLLLLENDTVIDYSGRKHVKRTVYQIALGACDYHVKDKKGNVAQNGMVEMIAEHFKKLPGKSTEEINKIMREQCEGQFPKGFENNEENRVASDSKALKALMEVIKKASDEDCELISSVEDDIYMIVLEEKSEQAKQLRGITQSVLKATEENFLAAFSTLKHFLIIQQIIKNDAFNFDMFKALYQFRNYLEPKGVVTSGVHFNHQLLIEVTQCYERNYMIFGNAWDKPKNLLCWQKVFGYVERFVPACDAQIIAQGLYSVIGHGDKSNRSVKFTRGEGKYFPLDSGIPQEIGYNCARGMWAQWLDGGLLGEGDFFRDLCRAKKAASSIMQHLASQPQKNCCVIL